MEKDKRGLIVIIFVLVGCFLAVAVSIWRSPTIINSDRPITPTVETHCVDNVCDTTYIYTK